MGNLKRYIAAGLMLLSVLELMLLSVMVLMLLVFVEVVLIVYVIVFCISVNFSSAPRDVQGE